MDINLLRRSCAAEGLLIESVDCGHLFEYAIVLPPFLAIIGPHSTLAARLEIPLPDHHQPLRLTVRERPQHHRVDDAEDGAVHPNPQGQAQRDDGCKHRSAAQYPQAITKVFPERLHRSTSCGK